MCRLQHRLLIFSLSVLQCICKWLYILNFRLIKQPQRRMEKMNFLLQKLPQTVLPTMYCVALSSGKDKSQYFLCPLMWYKLSVQQCAMLVIVENKILSCTINLSSRTGLFKFIILNWFELVKHKTVRYVICVWRQLFYSKCWYLKSVSLSCSLYGMCWCQKSVLLFYRLYWQVIL